MLVPPPGQTFLDHAAFFTRDMGAAEDLLARLGFVMTPFTHQANRTPEGPVPAGTANRCVMLARGYVEILTDVGDTPLAERLRQAVARYPGLHLVAFAEGDLDAGVARLAAGGFDPERPVALRRSVDLPGGGTAEAAFSVVRVAPETMPEGRIQLLAHHTPEIVWQDRWTAQPNGVAGLEGALLVVPDAAEAAGRYRRFTGGRLSEGAHGIRTLSLDRGMLGFAPTAEVARLLPVAPGDCPRPWIASLTLSSTDPERTRAMFAAAGAEQVASGDGRSLHRLPPALGGFVELVPPGSRPGFAA